MILGIESPCIGLCQLDQEGKYCIGCKRSIKEIKNWENLNDELKKVINQRIEKKKNENK
ncbi:hypothetical protein CBE37_04370 [bacterium TMED277]|nr:MAG: hypothetical protein CBE37_04370 [bacterium TMED277]